MKRHSTFVSSGYGLSLVALFCLLIESCAPVRMDVQFPAEIQLSEDQLKQLKHLSPLPVRAALVISEKVADGSNIYVTDKCPLTFRNPHEWSIAIGKEIERWGMATLPYGFQQVDVLSDTTAAYGRYDIILEVTPTLTFDTDCFDMIAYIGLVFTAPLAFFLDPSISAQLSLTVKVTDTTGKQILTQSMVTERGTGGPHAGRATQQALSAVLFDLPRRMASEPRLVQYAKSLRGTLQERMAMRAKGEEDVGVPYLTPSTPAAAQKPSTTTASSLPNPNQPGKKMDDRGVVVAPQVLAGSVAIAGEYWALIIGIDRYQQAPKLESAVKDATGVREVLVDRYGFKKERVIELLNEEATGPKIQNALYQLGHKTSKEDSVFIYYAGHGQYDDDGRLGWWVPVEAQPKDPGTFIPNASIRDYIQGMHAKHVYLVADSCFSGTLFGTRGALPPLNDQWYTRLYSKKSRWGLTSGGTEPVADRGQNGNSLFAYHFITLLRENTNPYLVPSHIFDQLAPVIANNADQTPRSEPLKGTGDEGGQFVFRLAQ